MDLSNIKISKVRDLEVINHFVLIDLLNNNLSETLIKTIKIPKIFSIIINKYKKPFCHY